MIRITKRAHSNVLQGNFDYDVIKSQEKSTETYVLYVLDGKDYIELGKLEATIKQLTEAYPLRRKQLIIALIHPGTSEKRWDAYSRAGDDFNNYLHFMHDEFIPTFEKDLAESGIGITKRGFLGDSLAGNMALNLAIKQPNKCTHLLLQSAAVSREDIMALQDLKEINWHIYQTVGVYEDVFISTMTNEKLYILTRNRALHEVFIENKANIHYTEQQEEHTWDFWKRDLPDLLTFFIETPEE